MFKVFHYYTPMLCVIILLDVLCYDSTRVKIGQDLDPMADYIHANFVEGYHRLRKFICTQGPLEQTALDFWRMVWQEKAGVVVCLTQLVERKQVKCFSYYPEDLGSEKQYGELSVKTTAVEHRLVKTQKIIVRDIIVSYGSSKRHVKHINYVDWPDRDVPRSQDFPSLLRYVKESQVSPSFFILFL